MTNIQVQKNDIINIKRISGYITDVSLNGSGTTVVRDVISSGNAPASDTAVSAFVPDNSCILKAYISKSRNLVLMSSKAMSNPTIYLGGVF